MTAMVAQVVVWCGVVKWVKRRWLCAGQGCEDVSRRKAEGEMRKSNSPSM